jgi:hypothetical protein
MKTGVLTKRQVRKLNKSFGLGVFRKKYVQDYSVLNRFLANVFGTAHHQIVCGNHVKHGFMGPEIISSDKNLLADCPDFWASKLGGYEIEDVHVYASDKIDQGSSISLYLKSRNHSDVFIPDNYVLMLPGTTFNILVSDNGTLSSIWLIFESKPPSFLKEFARDFRLKGPSYREKLRRQIKRAGTLPDAQLLKSVRFRDVITIEV